jgi:hypothetical protein
MSFILEIIREIPPRAAVRLETDGGGAENNQKED